MALEFVDDWKKLPALTGGIYYFLIRGKRVVYVGQSQNLRHRIKHHPLRSGAWATAVVVEDRTARSLLEKFCISHFNPPKNQNFVDRDVVYARPKKKNYTCETCQRKFYRKWYLKHHVRGECI